MKAEIRAVLQGLQLAKRMEIRKLWVQLDSIVVVGTLTKKVSWCLEHTGLLHQCKALIEGNDWEVRVSHCYREANRVADRLANMGIRFDSGTVFYSSPPMKIKDILLADGGGTYWPQHD